jgi:hypothetical protein
MISDTSAVAAFCSIHSLDVNCTDIPAGTVNPYLFSPAFLPAVPVTQRHGTPGQKIILPVVSR